MTVRHGAIYTRISHDPGNDRLGVQRQETECRRLAAQLGADVIAIYCDNDASAFSGKPRPAFEKMIDDISKGSIDVVVCWHVDRLYRRVQDLIPLIDAVQQAQATVATVKSGLLDLTSSTGRLVARIVGAIAEHDCEHQAERIRLKLEELALDGKWAGGTRPYGYRPTEDGALEIVPDEAAVVREAASRVLYGESTYSISADLNRRGVRTVRGSAWQANTVKQILTRASSQGLRSHNGSVVAKARWELILDEATVGEITLVLRNPRGRQSGPSRVALLSPDLIRCGRCGGPLHTNKRSYDGIRVYSCIGKIETGSCRTVSILGPPTEDFVAGAVTKRLTRRYWRSHLAEARWSDEDQKRLVRREAQLTELATDQARGLVTEAEWVRARMHIAQDVREAQHMRAEALAAEALEALTEGPDDMRRTWHTWPMAPKQRLISALVEQVVVAPAHKRGGRFEPERLSDGLRWRRSSA